ncbi:MAG: hypothetical protein V3U71_13505 [Cocleimonas sp.]
MTLSIYNRYKTHLSYGTVFQASLLDAGSFSRYENITDSLLSGSQGEVRNLPIQMDVNFDTGNVTNGALSANTSSDTWVVVFDGKIQSGDLD